MIHTEISDLLFVVQTDDRQITNAENFLTWYQSMNRLVDSETSAPNILASLYYIADYYFHDGLPNDVIELVVRRAESVFFTILRQAQTATVLELQMPVIFYVRLGLFDDAFRVVRQIILTVDECFDFQSTGHRTKTLTDLNKLLSAPIKSRMAKVRMSRKFLQRFKATDENNQVAGDGLAIAWEQYLALCSSGCSEMPVS